jgi:UDP-N-acetylglucosamine 2-epimerase
MPSDPIKMLTIFHTGPEVIKLAPVLRELQSKGELCSITVTTAQHREMIQDLLALFAIRPDHDFDIMQAILDHFESGERPEDFAGKPTRRMSDT